MTSSGSTFGVTGTAVRDTIITADGHRTRDMGGVYYAIRTLAALRPRGARIVPVMVVGEDAAARVHEDWGGLEGFVLDGVRTVSETNNAVEIEYAPDGSRGETQTGGLPELGWRDLQPWTGTLDAWLWNLVSGAETALGTFAALKGAFRGEIHLDLHSLCLEPAHGGVRRFRVPPAWRAWVEGVTWLQVNEIEAGLLHTGEPEAIDADGARALAGIVHGLGVEGLIITRGRDGAEWHGADGSVHIARPPSSDAVDPTGCGDVFGAAWFACRAMRGLSVESSLRTAVHAASAAATIRGTRDLSAVLKGATRV